MDKPYYYDHDEVFEAEIEPLLRQMYDRCQELGIPFVFIAQSRNDGETDHITFAQVREGADGVPIDVSEGMMIAGRYGDPERIDEILGRAPYMNDTDSNDLALLKIAAHNRRQWRSETQPVNEEKQDADSERDSL